MSYRDSSANSEYFNQKDKMKKPTVKLLGEDGNIFVISGKARNALKKAGLEEQGNEMINRVFKAKDYDEALRIVMEYVEPE